jgi:hypothetical protein
MNYIDIDQAELTLSLKRVPPSIGFLIPIAKSEHDVLERGFYKLLYFDVLYPYREDEDAAAGIKGRKYRLFVPDPWLVAVAAVMWQGLIQGLTWETVKYSVLKAIEFLKSKSLAPQENVPQPIRQKSIKTTKSRLEAGFSWMQFSKDGEPLHRLFLGITREFEKVATVERESIKRQYKNLFPKAKSSRTRRTKK